MINKRYFVVVVERNRTENRTEIEQCQMNKRTNERTNKIEYKVIKQNQIMFYF